MYVKIIGVSRVKIMGEGAKVKFILRLETILYWDINISRYFVGVIHGVVSSLVKLTTKLLTLNF